MASRPTDVGTVGPELPSRMCEPEFERMPYGQLLEYQFARFQAEFSRAFEHNAFYRARYRAAGVEPDQLRTRDDIRRVPTVRKADVLADAAASPPFGSRLGVPPDRIAQIVESSGTSGKGKEVQALTATELDQVTRAKIYQFVWPGCGPGTVVALHSPVSMSSGPLWNLAALARIEASPLRVGMLDTSARLEVMRSYRAEFVQASPAYLMRMEYAAEAMGWTLTEQLSSVRAICVSGGGWTVDWALERQRRWGARLYEVYASSQRAFTYTCELGMVHDRRPGLLHSLPHLHLIEVIDPHTGRHAEAGEEGEIVVTAFGATASPVVRYATGDRAVFRPAATCGCNRPFDGIEAGSVARYDDMLRIKEVNLWPLTIDEIAFSHAWLAEYRGEVDLDERGREVARIFVEFRSGADPASKADCLQDLGVDLRDRAKISFEIAEWTGESLTDSAAGGYDPISMKIRRWSDLRKEAMSRG
ncbi:MAG TPA: AMP-binding protein [Micromonosporaceae bacterium]